MTIVVTGASGDLGCKVTQCLMQMMPPDELVLVSRHPDALTALTRCGVRVRVGDFDKPESLRSAFAGGEKLLLISATAVGETRQRQHRDAIAAAVDAGVRHIVYTSSIGIHPRNPCFVIPDHRMTEQLLAASGIDFTILRMSSYADILVKAIAPHAIASGRWITSAADGLVAFVDKQDCARAAALTLTTQGHEGAVYEITGPDLLSHRHAASMASDMTGRSIEYVVPEEPPSTTFETASTTEDAQASTWIGQFSAAQLKSFEYAVRDGFYAICTRHVEMITKRPATPLRDVFRANFRFLVPNNV